MEIKWLGTAGFLIRTGRTAFLIDPYLTRNSQAFPVQHLKPRDLKEASHIFISHGHFDHLLDTPAIAAVSGARVYCSPAAAKTLLRKGVPSCQVTPVARLPWSRDFGAFSARAMESRHILFDKALLFSTLGRMKTRLLDLVRVSLPYPCGRVLSWRFEIEGKTLLFFGSAGADRGELERLSTEPVDILMVPLQGHSDICDIAARFVRVLSPKLVIPHHQDDFYPPMSQTVNPAPFLEQVTAECPGTLVRVMSMNETLSL